MPSYSHMGRYRDELAQLIEFCGSANELNTCLAFRDRPAVVPHRPPGANSSGTQVRAGGIFSDRTVQSVLP